MAKPLLKAIFPSLPGAKRGNPIVIGTCKDGDNIVYCNGRSVFIAPIDDPKSARVYSEHAVTATVAKISPNGNWCASGDVSGTIRIWDITQPNMTCKRKIQVLNGPIRDIAWCNDSQRIVAVGEGPGRFGHVFFAETGASIGSIDGPSHTLNSADFKRSKPHKIVAGSENREITVFKGPPFKFENTLRTHEKSSIHSIRYSPDGSMYASAGADKQVFLYDGETNENIGSFVEADGKAHNGSVYAVTWSPDGTKIATASADKTVIIWDVETRRVLKNFTFSSKLEDQQVGIIWTKKALVSISASGAINKLDLEQEQSRTVRTGHNKAITSLTLATSVDENLLYSADVDGHVIAWDLENGHSTRLSPDLHPSKITGLCCRKTQEQENIFSIGFDDQLCITPIITSAKETSTVIGDTVKHRLTQQPTGLSVSEDGRTSVVVCHNKIAILIESCDLRECELPFNTYGIAISPNGEFVAVGDQKQNVVVFKLIQENVKNDVKPIIEEDTSLELQGDCTAVEFSPDGNFLVVVTSKKQCDISVEWFVLK
uniref:WD_REPEATS_REGION domain-containing protein n=1 Tax=Caenorhabditis japonica TaxID=281687 RepID=A0A8R1HTE8_CAEJA